MKAQSKSTASIVLLMATAVVITLLGVGYGVYAIVTGAAFSVMGTQIPGAAFAAVVAFLGVRYLLATLRLAKKIKGERFSWSNFKKQSVKGNV